MLKFNGSKLSAEVRRSSKARMFKGRKAKQLQGCGYLDQCDFEAGVDQSPSVQLSSSLTQPSPFQKPQPSCAQSVAPSQLSGSLFQIHAPTHKASSNLDNTFGNTMSPAAKKGKSEVTQGNPKA